MAPPENRIFCRLDGLTPAQREQKRITALQERGLLTAETVPIFDEATQTGARFLDAPICILGIMVYEQLQIKSALGLSRVRLMNPLAQSRQLPRHQSFCTYVVDSHQVLAIEDTSKNPIFASSLLFEHYGIRAYLGVPLVTADEQCLGTLAVMDLEPRCFRDRDIQFLAMTARWSLSEFERNRLFKQEGATFKNLQSQTANTSGNYRESDFDHNHGIEEISNSSLLILSSTNSIKVKLLHQLTQQLRTPLTSVMGMSSVLSQQVYGSLTSKQVEYLEIIHRSGQNLLSLVDEIVALSLLDETNEKLNLTSVDLEMLSQLVIKSLSEMAEQRQQQMRLSIAPGSRIWLLDKDKVRQMLYYLVFSIINSAEAGGEIRIHISSKSQLEKSNAHSLKIAVWVSHPCFGDGLPQIYRSISNSALLSPMVLPSSSNSRKGAAKLSPVPATAIANALESPLSNGKPKSGKLAPVSSLAEANQVISSASIWATFTLDGKSNPTRQSNESLENLGLLLSCHLAELHAGKISIQGSSELGYRYVISLPEPDSGWSKGVGSRE
ncbi:MAG: GAF domain-containing sensor histidine kinase [Symploca sp. SIO2E9]|nr:GAF domain-containing sensor histidine kinase [Symploca sp. SIO2E9]